MKHPQSRILLDPVGDAIVPEGYRVLKTEVEFLEFALSSDKLFIKGKRLCNWAKRFYRGREIAYASVESPSRTLRNICPQLDEDQAKALAERLIMGNHIPQADWTISDILACLHPEARWYDPLSVEHAAWWLLWLQENEANKAEQVLLHLQSDLWVQLAEELLKPIYEASDSSTAVSLLEEWLCLAPRQRLDANLPQFPAPLPDGLKSILKNVASDWYVQCEGRALEYLESRAPCHEAKQIVAQIGVKYYQAHPELLSRDKFQKLYPYLRSSHREELDKLIPPPEPTPLNEQQPPKTILQWVAQQYLPYRLWATRYGKKEQIEATEHLALQFIHWLLDFYPRALQGREELKRLLVFNRVWELKKLDMVSLLILLDGLGWGDALILHEHIKRASDVLIASEPEPVLSALPTITHFAKTAILQGVPPRLALDTQNPVAAIGEVLPEGNIPEERLSKVELGECFIWRVNEPDKTYHERYDARTLLQDVETEIANLAKKILHSIQAMPRGLPKQIVITSDHGRLFGESKRVLRPPDGMQAKGRAAWGDSNLPFGEDGYFIDKDTGLLFLHAERFGLAHHVAVPLDTGMFVAEGGRGGAEKFAHGGIHPEEVIVPWLRYFQNVQVPRIKCQAIVRGRVSREGTLELKISNLEAYPVRVDTLRLMMRTEKWHSLPVEQKMEAFSTFETMMVLPVLPTKAQWKHVHAILKVNVDTAPFEVEVEVKDETREMYHTTDLLEELQ